jgi:hypothetical protein
MRRHSLARALGIGANTAIFSLQLPKAMISAAVDRMVRSP